MCQWHVHSAGPCCNRANSDRLTARAGQRQSTSAGFQVAPEADILVLARKRTFETELCLRHSRPLSDIEGPSRPCLVPAPERPSDQTILNRLLRAQVGRSARQNPGSRADHRSEPSMTVPGGLRSNQSKGSGRPPLQQPTSVQPLFSQVRLHELMESPALSGVGHGYGAAPTRSTLMKRRPALGIEVAYITGADHAAYQD